MTDRGKVIKGLESCCKYPNEYGDCLGGDCPYKPRIDCHKELMRDAVALLKAQEPVKPKRYQECRWFKTWRCGACGGTLVFRNGTDKPKYCTDCGRAVKWDD